MEGLGPVNGMSDSAEINEAKSTYDAYDMMLQEAILDAGLRSLKRMRCRDIGGFIRW